MIDEDSSPPQEIIDSTDRIAPNPFAHSSSITVSVPETVDVKLVDASSLGDYEVWVLLTSILSSAVTGFLVALMQSADTERSIYVYVTIVFALMTAICGIMAFTKRRRLTSKAKKLRFRIGDPVVDDS